MNEGQQQDAAKKGSELGRCVRSALVQQVIIFILAGMILDGGQIAQICVFGFVAFWVAVALLVTRRRKRLTRGDLVFIEGGSIVVCVLSFVVSSGIWQMRSVW